MRRWLVDAGRFLARARVVWGDILMDLDRATGLQDALARWLAHYGHFSLDGYFTSVCGECRSDVCIPGVALDVFLHLSVWELLQSCMQIIAFLKIWCGQWFNTFFDCARLLFFSEALQVLKALLKLLDALSVIKNDLDEMIVDFMRDLATMKVADAIANVRVHVSDRRPVWRRRWVVILSHEVRRDWWSHR